MVQEPANHSRGVPGIILCVGLVAFLLSCLSAPSWAWLARWSLIHTPVALTMGLLGVIDPRLFYAVLPQQQGIPLWARIVGGAGFVGAAILTMALVVARYGHTLPAS